MKIGLICRNFLSRRGGLENYTIATACALSQRGHEVHIFANKAEWHKGLLFHKVPMVSLSSPCKNLSFAINATKIALRHQLHVIQSMERIWSQDIFRASDGINPIQISKKYPNPKTRKIKSLMLRRVALSFLEKKIFEKNGARFILTNSQLVKNQILSHYNIQENRIHVIYNGVDTDRFNPALKTEFKQSIRKKVCVERDELLVLFAGNDPRQKGLDLLLKAVSLTGSQNIKLMVAGSFSLAQLNKMTEVIGNKSSTIFLGFEPRLELFLAAADLFILPTLYDPFSNVCLEAMACGTPVITTANNGASEIIDQGRTGFILKTSNPRELSTLINKFDTEVDKIQMSARAHQKAKHFKISRHIDNLLNLYGKVIENKESAWK